MKDLFNSSHRSWLYRVLMAIFVLAIAAAVALPNYITGNWKWATPPKVPHQSQLREVKDTGLSLSPWQTIEHYAGKISGYAWSIQTVAPNETIAPMDEAISIQAQNPAVVLLRPQTWYRDMPQVEWMDINGVQKWKTDQKTTLTFTVSPDANSGDNSRTPEPTGDRPIQVNTRFFRGWNRQQTYAVMQWYAWPTGGSSSASRWFWVDQLTQLRDHHRMPWVAVSVLVPIKPLGDIQSARSTAEALAQQVQATLIHDVFSGDA
ncbi:MAG: cyanoexosortase B system-associated protein [Cyanobacteria bacterium P01_E01_bin.6]